MNRVALLLSLSLAYFVAGFSQAQLWDVALNDGGNPNADYKLDNSGNAFLSTPHLTTKISPAGVELWRRNFGGALVVDRLENVCVQDSSQLRKYGPNGDSLWTYDIPAWKCGEVYQYYHLSIDPGGNAFIFNECTKALTKVSAGGVGEWTVVLPLLRILTDPLGRLSRIGFDRQGNAYVPFEDHFAAASGGPDLVGMMKVRPDGSIAWRTTWASDIRSNQENFKTVRFQEYGWVVRSTAVDSNGNSYMGGTEVFEVDRSSSLGEYQSVVQRWRITGLTPTGEEKTRIIKGPGKVVTRTRAGHQINTTALNETELYSIALRDGKILAYGVIDERKRSRGSVVGLLIPVLTQVKSSTLRTEWKTKLAPNRFGAAWGLLLNHPSKAFFIPSEFNTIPPTAYLIRIDTGGVAQLASEQWIPGQSSFDWRTASFDETGCLFVLRLGEGGMHLIKYSNTNFSALPGVQEDPSRAAESGISKFKVAGNYPNPFNPTTTIEFDLPHDALITAKVYNILGQEVATLADKDEFTEGFNELEFDASNLPSGVYSYRIVAERVDGAGAMYSTVKRMMLIK